jgi:hypothetical protein
VARLAVTRMAGENRGRKRRAAKPPRGPGQWLGLVSLLVLVTLLVLIGRGHPGVRRRPANPPGATSRLVHEHALAAAPFASPSSERWALLAPEEEDDEKVGGLPHSAGASTHLPRGGLSPVPRVASRAPRERRAPGARAPPARA